VLCSLLSLYGNSQPHVVKALSYVGEKETSPNRSKNIDTWNRFVGNKMGYPYCAAFGSYVFNESKVRVPKLRTGLARNFYTKSPLAYSAGDVLMKRKTVKSGDGVVWARGNTISGHFAIAAQNWIYKSGKTVEANTSSGLSGSQFDGDGVWVRIRTISPYSYFRIIGFTGVSY
jgi:hypothetical protein